jgi:hypothetical protein
MTEIAALPTAVFPESRLSKRLFSGRFLAVFALRR